MSQEKYSTNFTVRAIPVVAEKLEIGASYRVSNEEFKRWYPAVADNLNISVFKEAAGPYLVAQLRSFLMDSHKLDHMETTDIKTPATPWQFFKQLHMPMWFKKRWPVVFNTQCIPVSYHHHYMCPHVDTPNMKRHVYWMISGPSNKDSTS